MTESRHPGSIPAHRAEPRKAWRQPAMTVLAASSAELAGGGADDGTDLS